MPSVVPGVQVLPFDLARQFALAALDHEAEFKRVVDQRHRHAPVGIGTHPVFPDLLMEVYARVGHGPVADRLRPVGLGMRGPGRMDDRRQIPAAFRQHRMADIDVIQHHVWRAAEAVVDYAVMQRERRAAYRRLDTSDQMQILAEHGRLLHDTFAEQHALVVAPLLAIADETPGDGADAAMDRAVH